MGKNLDPETIKRINAFEERTAKEEKYSVTEECLIMITKSLIIIADKIGKNLR